MTRALLLALTCLVASTACGNDPDSAAAPSELTGAIVATEPENGPVRASTLEADGERHEIFIADDVDYGFDLQHLHEHLATGDPVRCTLEQRGGRLYALAIADA
jgi:hypothetical protein